MVAVTRAELAARVDQTLLSPTATPAQVEALCEGARRLGFRAVCVNPCYVPLAARCLQGSGVRVCTVVGFPLGAGSVAVKAFEAGEAVRAGAADVDMVINLGRLKAGEEGYVRDEVRAVVEAARAARPDAVVKVIIEACHLTDAEKEQACRAAAAAGADFVKTSTGFGPGGATVEDVRLMRRVVGDRLGVKAAGGIRTLAQALALLEAGADVLGTSAGEAIVASLE